jgi:hypothetical protein
MQVALLVSANLTGTGGSTYLFGCADEKNDFSSNRNDRFPSVVYLCICSFGGGAREES